MDHNFLNITEENIRKEHLCCAIADKKHQCGVEAKNTWLINHIPLDLIRVDSREKAKAVPCVFNNWAVFYQGKFKTLHLLNAGYLKQLLEQ